MKCHLFANIAIFSLMTAVSFAQDTANTKVEMDNSQSVIFSPKSVESNSPDKNGYVIATFGQVLASSMLGKTVYFYQPGKPGKQAVGDINDLLLDANGNAQAAILGVGGFLGIGEKEVAIKFNRLSWMNLEGTRHLVLNASKQNLNDAPAFKRAALHLIHREGLLAVDRSTISADKMIGTSVYGANNEEIGEISDVILTAQSDVEAYILDIGGFLGIGEKPVAMDVNTLTVYKDSENRLHIYTPYTQEQLELQRPYSPAGYKSNRNLVIMR